MGADVNKARITARPATLTQDCKLCSTTCNCRDDIVELLLEHGTTPLPVAEGASLAGGVP